MSGYHVMVVLSVLLTLSKVASSLQTCQQDDFIRLQTECRDQNKRFTDAEKVAADDERGPVSEICTALFDMWRCVARNIPQCFLNTTTAYASYTHSPHNCQMSPKLLLELQTLVFGGIKTVTSTVVMDETMLTTTQEPRSTSEEGEGDGEDEDDENDNEEGNSSSQTTNGSSISRCSSLWLFFTAWLSTREMVRVTFRS
ncbi:uncharacterized protein LOC112559475 isoform X2 [Pomacea canaliculata]|uniref:uncharacterized protein LOC112559475 isoform X2 n=1 Tax=Pomacea canaliculata TaxID=400727 RepID=UPI000D72E78D|nr:uncharacterized protein LOC112559475 isoform X2 [Pomacea canaliculata]